MPMDFSATPRGSIASSRESKSAGEIVGGMLNMFKKVRALLVAARSHRALVAASSQPPAPRRTAPRRLAVAPRPARSPLSQEVDVALTPTPRARRPVLARCGRVPGRHLRMPP